MAAAIGCAGTTGMTLLSELSSEEIAATLRAGAGAGAVAAAGAPVATLLAASVGAVLVCGNIDDKLERALVKDAGTLATAGAGACESIHVQQQQSH